MSLPAVTVEAQFDLVHWTDISSRARAGRIVRGKQQTANKVQPGKSTLTLDNRDRALEPEYAGSPYYPYILDGCPLRVKITWLGFTYTLIEAAVEQWPASYPKGVDGVVQVTAVDAMTKLQNGSVTSLTAWPLELSGARVNRYFDAIFGAGSARSVGTGWSTVQAYTPTQANPLTDLQIIEASENGLLFVAQDGTPVFLDRQTQLKPPYNTSQATFADPHTAGPSDLPFADLVPTLDNSVVKNQEIITAPGMSTVTCDDATSQGQRGIRSESVPTLLTTQGDMLALGLYRLGLYAQPGLRFQQMTLDPTADDRLWPLVLGLDLHQRITPKWTPQNPDGSYGAAMSLDCLIEGVQHAWDTKSWSTVWALSNAQSADYWLLDTSKIDVSARPAF